MTQATDRMFARMERTISAYSEDARPYVLIGALKARLEIIAERFPEVEADIADMEDFLARNRG